MRRLAPLMLAALLAHAGCSSEPRPAPNSAPGAVTSHELAQSSPDAPSVPQSSPAQAPARPPVASGLPIGERFAAFEIVNCESGDEYCHVCTLGSLPKIMAAGTIDDEAFHEDLKNIDAIVAKYGEDRVGAFAVIGEAKDGRIVTPLADRDALQARAKQLRKELDISMPVVLPAPRAGAVNETWETHYKITSSRTLMFADGRNEVRYSAIAPTDLGALDAAIKAVVGS